LEQTRFSSWVPLLARPTVDAGYPLHTAGRASSGTWHLAPGASPGATAAAFDPGHPPPPPVDHFCNYSAKASAKRDPSGDVDPNAVHPSERGSVVSPQKEPTTKHDRERYYRANGPDYIYNHPVRERSFETFQQGDAKERQQPSRYASRHSLAPTRDRPHHPPASIAFLRRFSHKSSLGLRVARHTTKFSTPYLFSSSINRLRVSKFGGQSSKIVLPMSVL
jgi:hypothetical protein